MATIGYGNIVPVTSYGRIACIIFALFGVPLAIITIGDLGKFLSECIIWLYTKSKKSRCSRHFINFKWLINRNPELRSSDKSNEAMKQFINWDDLALDKAEVPLVLVFAILLFYIAFGGLLFASFEPWTYMDAFYFCFVSLTTIGFGDFVPESQEYVLLMLIYLGFGLAVTTMCIDLVGIQYIQKIHYFGRKFRAADILQLLKRRQMIEHGLTVDQSDELLKLYLRQLQEAGTESLEESKWHLCNNALEMLTPSNYDISDDNNNSDLQCIEIHKISSIEHAQITLHAAASMQSSSKSLAICDEKGFKQLHNKLNPSNQIDEKQQNFSNHSSIQSILLPETSLEGIKNENYRKRSSPLDRFSMTSSSERLSNLKLIATNSPIPIKGQPLSSSQLSQLSQQQLAETVSVMHVSPTSSPTALASMMQWDSYSEMLNESSKPFAEPENRATEMFLSNSMIATYENEDYLVEHEEIARVQATCVTHRDSISSDSSESIIAFPVEVDRDEISEQETDPNSDSEKDIMHGDSTVFSIENTALDTRMTLKSVLNCPFEYINKQPPLLAMENYCFVINGDLVDVEQIIENSKSWWKQTSSRVRYYLSKGMKTFYEVDALLCRGELRCAYARRGRAASIEPIPLEQIFRVSRIYSHWKTCISFHRIISCISPVTKNATEVYGFQKRIFVQYLWRTEKREEKRRVAREYRTSKIPIPSTNKTATDRLRKLSLFATFDKSPSLMQNSIGTMISGRNYPSYIPQPKVNYQPKQTLQANLSTSFNRRHSLIPQLRNSRRRSEQQRIHETLKTTLPKSIDNKNRPVSLLEIREQFQKHQKKFRKRQSTSTINC